ncbi:hypothetical protein OS175_10580 [Marinicella sp. S1101]|nr:PEP/pyruvate-binding domain-containing protein [Marinicella marina]MCX7554326.1 hypothetical protein [Marinicella marina]MDJ1138683.1 PEP/pyruvate-binding domain-containing protein [Marinicella marina]
MGVVSSSQASGFDWEEACPETNISQWVASCESNHDKQFCLRSFSRDYLNHPSGVYSDKAVRVKNFLYDTATDQTPNALLNKIWELNTGCSDYDHGKGVFNQHLSLVGESVKVIGSIPAGKAQVRINISTNQDVDLQLYDGDTALVDKNSGLLNGADLATVSYQGMEITYSGFEGDANSAGNEFITLSGITSSALRVRLAGHQDAEVTVSYQWGLDPSLGATYIINRQVYNDLSVRSATPGAIGIRELKFIIKDIDTDFPSVYFMHSEHVPLHIDFAYDVLDWYPTLNYDEAYRVFNSSTYFLDARKHLAGSILAHDKFINPYPAAKGLYTLQLWPTDPVAAPLIVKAHQLLTAKMRVLDGNLVYFPGSDTQTNIYLQNQAYFDDNEVAVIDSETLFDNVSYTAMNLAEGYGTLRVVNEGDPTPSVNDVVIFTFIPNDLAHVAGIITDTVQTPLSHINLKAKQNNTPNAFIQDAAENPFIKPLLNQLVHYQVNHDGFVIEPATQAEVDQWLEQVRPQKSQEPQSDLSVVLPARLDTLRHSDWIRFGAKAANVAELAQVLEPGSYPVGYAIPFAMYDDFMQMNRCQGFEDDGITPDGKYRDLCDDSSDPNGKSLYQQIQQIMAAEAFINSPDVRLEQLKDFRKEVRKSEVPADMAEVLESMRYFWDPDGDFTHSIRLRSSTNNEDLAGFNGAGLYESNTHHPDEGLIGESVKKVWASLWTSRAFEERRFYRIDHFKTYMGVLVHLSYGDEQVNGVAVTKNIYDRNWEGYYVNAQYGEISVTNPEPIVTSEGEVGAIPDEFLLARLVSSDTDYSWVQQYIRRSNVETVYGQPVPTINVLLDDEVRELRVAMQRIQSHFKAIYAGDEDFAMDIEFKITRTDDGSRGHLEIKQARPWID